MGTGTPLILFVALQCLAAGSCFKVFGVSPGRSGTDSQRVALTKLGFGPTMHMKELLAEESGIPTFHHFRLYEAAAKGEMIGFREMLEAFNSGVDYPISCFPEELLQAFPDARFILNIRPAAAWYNSLQQTICGLTPQTSWAMKILAVPIPFFPFKTFYAMTQMMDAVIAHKFVRDRTSTWGDFCLMEQALVEQIYHNWTAHVKTVIPASQLLVFQVGKDGYKELAGFLDVPVPNEDYPSINSAAEFQTILVVVKVVAVAVVLVPTAAVFFVVKRIVGTMNGKQKKT